MVRKESKNIVKENKVGIGYELIGKNGVRCYLEFENGIKKLIPFVFNLNTEAICWSGIGSGLNTAIIDKASLMSVNIGGEYENDYQYYCYHIEGGKYGCINQEGKIQIPLLYEQPIIFENPHLAVAVLNGKHFLINPFGNIIKHSFDDVVLFKGNFLLVKENGNFGVVDYDLSVVVAPNYENIRLNSRYATVFIDKKCGIVDLNRKEEVIPFGFDNIIEQRNEIFNNCFTVCIGNKYGMLSTDGEVIIPIEFEYLVMPESSGISFEDCFLVRRFGYYGVVNYDIRNIYHPDRPNWEVVVSCEYDCVYNDKGKLLKSGFSSYLSKYQRVYFVKYTEGAIAIDCYGFVEYVYKSQCVKKLKKIVSKSFKSTDCDISSYIINKEKVFQK